MEKFNNIIELIKFYKNFENKSLENLFDYINEKFPDIKINTNKGAAGQILEALIGNAPNSDPNPDVKDITMMRGREPKPLFECNGFCGTNDLEERSTEEQDINYQLDIFDVINSKKSK